MAAIAWQGVAVVIYVTASHGEQAGKFPSLGLAGRDIDGPPLTGTAPASQRAVSPSPPCQRKHVVLSKRHGRSFHPEVEARSADRRRARRHS